MPSPPKIEVDARCKQYENNEKKENRKYNCPRRNCFDEHDGTFRNSNETNVQEKIQPY